MDSNQFDATLLTGILELNEMVVGGNPVPQPGVVHKRGKGTSKQSVLIAAQRHGSVRAVHINDEKACTVRPIVGQLYR